jgi:hypothetical protein
METDNRWSSTPSATTLAIGSPHDMPGMDVDTLLLPNTNMAASSSFMYVLGTDQLVFDTRTRNVLACVRMCYPKHVLG